MEQAGFTKRKRLGYCLGITTESILYNMFYTYYLIFLTDVVKLNPALAGTVNLISVAWDAITDPIVGKYADREGVDKRKLMLKAAIPVGITFVGAFLPLGDNTNEWLKFFFYVAMTMLFWLAYTVYTIPYYAVVAEITQDYDERTAIRGQSSLFNTVCIFMGNAVPSLLPGILGGLIASIAFGWTLTAVVMGAIAIVAGLVAAASLKGVRLQKAEAQQAQEKGSFKEYLEILRIKPFRWFVMFVFFFLVATSMIQTNFTFLVKHKLGMSDDDMVIVIVTLVAAMAVIIPIVTKIAEKTDRRITSIIFTAITLVALVVIKFIGISNVVMLIVSVVACAIGLGCFWTVFYSMSYDLVEVDEYVNGKRRESMITAFPQFFQKFGAAIGMWLAGQVLSWGKYDAELATQPDSAKTAIENISTIIPAAFLVFAVIGLIFYPVTKKSFEALKEKLELKRQGKKTDNKGIEKLV